MASDSLNQVGKFIKKANRKSDLALKRYSKRMPTRDRVRDTITELTPLSMTIHSDGGDSTTLDIKFDKPPPVECEAPIREPDDPDVPVDVITSPCETWVLGVGGHSINVGTPYEVGSVSVFLNGSILSTSQWYEENPSAGQVYVQVAGSTSLVGICYTAVIPGGRGVEAGIQGYGANALANLPPAEYVVSQLSGSGSGTFIGALAWINAGNEGTVRFTVDGTIDLGEDIRYITGRSNWCIDGRDANITLLGSPIWIRNNSHHYAILNIRHAGGAGGGQDADNFTNTVGCHDFAYVNVSTRGAADENISSTQECYNYTYQDCIFGPSDPAHNYGSLNAYNTDRGSSIRNLWINKEYRNPKFSWDDDLNGDYPDNINGDVVNDVMINCDYGVTSDFKAKVNIRGCYMRNVDNPSETIRLGTHYQSGNVLVDSGTFESSVGSPYTVEAFAQVEALTANEALAYVRANAGTFPRDSFDSNLIAQV